MPDVTTIAIDVRSLCDPRFCNDTPAEGRTRRELVLIHRVISDPVPPDLAFTVRENKPMFPPRIVKDALPVVI
jgi:hypothetical protein